MHAGVLILREDEKFIIQMASGNFAAGGEVFMHMVLLQRQH